MRLEILVVDNGSTDKTAEVIHKHSTNRIPVCYISEPQTGLSYARNTGLAASCSDIILFTDDDVSPSGGWLESIATPLLQRKCDAVVGSIDLAPEVCRPWMTHEHKSNLTEFHGEPFQLIGANMGFHRSVLDRVAEFDTELGAGALGFAEDTLFSWQLVEAGFGVKYVPEASMIHYPDTSRLARSNWLSLGRRHGASMAYLLHHWFHEVLRSPRLRYLFLTLKLRLRRLLQPPIPLDAEGIDPWEISYVGEMEKCRQFMIESRRPRNYSKRGLRRMLCRAGQQESLQIEGKPLKTHSK